MTRYVPGQSIRRLDPYRSGDLFVKESPVSGKLTIYVVADPARTSYGKLRLIRESGTILTTWWGRDGTTSLPPHYRHHRATRPVPR